MTKTRKSMLMTSVGMLLIATLALSSASFAWFSSGSSGTVEKMKFTTEAASGIQISADAVNFKSILTESDLKYSGNTNALVPTMKPVSSVGDVTTGSMALFSGVINNDKLVTTAEVKDSTNGKYWVMDIYVKNEGDTKDLYLDFGKCSVAGYAKAKSATVGDNVITNQEDKSSGIENSVRFAFVDQGTGVTGTTVQTADLVKAATAGTASVIYEPNDTAHTSYAQTYRYKVYSADGISPATYKKGETSNDIIGSNAGSLTYVGVKAAYGDATANPLTGIPLAKGAAADLFTSADSTPVVCTAVVNTNKLTTTIKGVKIASLTAQAITKVTIYCWIEGQDVDCNNNESGGSVQFTLAFDTKDPSSTTTTTTTTTTAPGV